MKPLDLPRGEGVLAGQHLRRAMDSEVAVITSGEWSNKPENVQPASLDLRLGRVAYRLRCSFLPGEHEVERRYKEFLVDVVDLSKGEGAVLETKRPYLIPLKERLNLPKNVRARANPKSSTGRVDVFTRVITDNSYQFDEITPGYQGGLYLEVVPLSFPIFVREDLCLNQLRLTVGNATLSDDDIRAAHDQAPILFRKDGDAIRKGELPLSSGLFLSLDLSSDKARRVGYRAKATAHTAPPLDLTETSLNPDHYWDPVPSEDDHIILGEEGFYLLMSDEAVSIPPSLAAEMTAYDPTNGELRTHYAGFFDPGFGYDPNGQFHGSRAALEVRAHDVAFMIEHRQRVCRLTFEKMLESPDMLYGSAASSYQNQDDPLGKHFSRAALESQPGRRRTVPPDHNQPDLGL